MYRFLNTDEKSNFEIDTTSLKVSICNATKYKKFASIIESKISDGKEYYCFDHKNDTSFKNAQKEANSRYINFIIRACNPSTSQCPKDLYDVTTDFFLQLSFMNSYFDSNNYTDPIQIYEYVYTIQGSKDLQKRQFIRFNNNEYMSDNGWILENYMIYNYISLQDIRQDINPVDKTLNLVQISLESPKIKEVTKRSYLKIQELVAKIGGLIKGFHVLLIFFSYFYFKFEYVTHLAELSFIKQNQIKNESKLLDLSKFVNSELIQKNEVLVSLKSQTPIYGLNKSNLINNEKEDDIRSKNENENLKLDKLRNNSLTKNNHYHNQIQNVQNSEILEIFNILKETTFFSYLRGYICCNKKFKENYEKIEEYLMSQFSYCKVLNMMLKESNYNMRENLSKKF